MKKSILKFGTIMLICTLMLCLFVACDNNKGLTGANEDSSISADSSKDTDTDNTVSENNGQDVNAPETDLPKEPSVEVGVDGSDDNQVDDNVTDDNQVGDNSTDDNITEDKIAEDEFVVDLSPLYPKYANVGEKYGQVIKPFKDFAQYIVDDLVNNDVIVVPQEAEIASFRYFNGNSIDIEFRVMPYIYGTEEKSDFLYICSFVSLEDFGVEWDEWCNFRDFLINERKLEGYKNYVSTMLPVAEKMAEDLTAKYHAYIDKNGYDKVKCGRYDNNIVLKSNSYLSEIHVKIIEQMNKRLAVENLPLLTDEEIVINLGGIFVDGEPLCNNLQVQVELQNYNYNFNFTFNEDGALDTSWLLYFANSMEAGYYNNIEFMYVPLNEEYAEFFNTLKIDEMDFLSVQLYTLIDENTYLYF